MSGASLDPLCDTLALFNISGSKFDSISLWGPTYVCDSLREVDISGASLPHIRPIPGQLVLHNRRESVSVFRARIRIYPSATRTMTTFYANNLASPEHSSYLKNCSLFLLYEFSEIHLSGNQLIQVDTTYNSTHDHLRILDLSHNNMKVIGSRLLHTISHLYIIDLSYNKLSEIQNYATFWELFKYNNELESINLSENKISDLPNEMFSKNLGLKKLNLSSNLLQQITFDITQLTDLIERDLSNDSIE